MSWRLGIRHVTTHDYDAEVTASYNEVRLTPLTDPGQLTLDARVVTDPETRQQSYWDYWGTQVISFDLHRPHRTLTVTATSLVDTADATEPTTLPGWELTRDPAVRDTHLELLTATDRTRPDESMTSAAAALAADLPPYEAAVAIGDLVRERVVYVPGATGVRTGAQDAWRLGQGVCQDIAHVTLAMLRSVGLPARYVSGYLAPQEDAEIGQVVVGESHAWVEVWLGAWWGFDPTNGIPAGERHVVVARGRDYGDVAPLKGIYSGGGAQTIGVTVEVTRLS